MNTLRCLALLSLFGSCKQSGNNPNLNSSGVSACISSESNDTTNVASYKTVRGALLGTRFTSLEELKSVIRIEYHPGAATRGSHESGKCYVCVRHCSGGKEVTSIMETGVTQGDLHRAGYSDAVKDRLNLLFRCPFAVVNRKDLEKVFNLSRRKPDWFGEGDPAFFDMAKAMADNINTPELAFKNDRDSTEKGYINSFNHITAQAIMTTCFSEELAEFIADAHERNDHPELITGKFTEAQIKDLGEGPVDNYVDLVNNEWGQELGKQLKAKYGINSETNWTPKLVADYLNDLQSYYSWAFQIGFKPFRPEDEVVFRLSDKMNAVMQGRFNFDR